MPLWTLVNDFLDVENNISITLKSDTMVFKTKMNRQADGCFVASRE